jgi:hypothetical protein
VRSAEKSNGGTIGQADAELTIAAPPKTVHDAVLRLSNEFEVKVLRDDFDGTKGVVQLESAPNQNMTLSFAQKGTNATTVLLAKANSSL